MIAQNNDNFLQCDYKRECDTHKLLVITLNTIVPQQLSACSSINNSYIHLNKNILDANIHKVEKSVRMRANVLALFHFV